MSSVRLLVSTFGAEEARSAIRGGCDIVDIEDPKTDVGMYAVSEISNIASAVRQSEGSRIVRTSVNIGANLLLYSSVGGGRAVPRSPADIAARAGQQAVGIAAAMDTGTGRSNIIKFGVDGLKRGDVTPFVRAVKQSVRENGRYGNHQVIGSFLPIDLPTWNTRKTLPAVIEQLVRQGVFFFTPDGPIDVMPILGVERTKEAMARAGAGSSRAQIVEPDDPESLGFSGDLERRTREYVDLITAGGADGVMIDTPVQAKAARICLLDHIQNKAPENSTPVEYMGLYTLDALKRFTGYCHYKAVEVWCAGSIQFFHAEALGTLKFLDVMLCRGVVSSAMDNPYDPTGAATDRTSRRIDSEKVAKMVGILRDAKPV
jgi:uncharacterized protein (UPF0264 family)